MHVIFLTPLGGLAAFALLLPIGAVLRRERRDGRLRRAVRLSPPARRVVPALAGAAVVACFAAAAAQPAIRTSAGAHVRKDAQIYFVFDISGSMAASARPGAPTRLVRAKTFALRLHRRLAEVPAGVATLTDRLLASLPPTADRPLFVRVIRRVIGVNRPPPAGVTYIATQFSALVDLALQRYFSSGTPHRLAVVLSDTETDYFDPGTLRNSLAALQVGLVVVRFWHPDEAIYGPKGKRDAKYQPDAMNLPRVQTLGAESVGGRLFGEGDLGAVARAARAYLGHGPTRAIAPERRTIHLGPYAVLASVLPLLFLLRRR
jgi:hypothetical protein